MNNNDTREVILVGVIERNNWIEAAIEDVDRIRRMALILNTKVAAQFAKDWPTVCTVAVYKGKFGILTLKGYYKGGQYISAI